MAVTCLVGVFMLALGYVCGVLTSETVSDEAERMRDALKFENTQLRAAYAELRQKYAQLREENIGLNSARANDCANAKVAANAQGDGVRRRDRVRRRDSHG